MRVGVVTELKNREDRVALTPAGAAALAADGHEVVVEAGAGTGSHFTDEEYRSAGARIYETASDVWADADLLLKVKEPVEAEYRRLREGQVLFTFLHAAADPAGTRALLDSGTTAIAYETVEGPDGGLPLLSPMSEVAGRLAAQVGAYHLMTPAGGRGVLLGGVPGVPPAEVVVIGGGVAGTQAATVAVGMGAHVTVLDVSVPRLRELDERFAGRVTTVASNQRVLGERLLEADLVVGAVLVPGAKAPTLVSNELVSRLKRGTVLVDISVDQGGCFEDSRPTTHDAPTFPVHDTVFYCVANMPAAVPRTSTLALTNVTLPYIQRIAADGWRTAIAADSGLAAGLTAHAGQLTQPAVAEALGLPSVDRASALEGA